MNNNTNRTRGGIGFFGAMFLIFMTLKLTNYIDWSWWWVTAPLWGGLALFLLVFIVVFIFIFVAEMIEDARWRKRMKRDRR